MRFPRPFLPGFLGLSGLLVAVACSDKTTDDGGASGSDNGGAAGTASGGTAGSGGGGAGEGGAAGEAGSGGAAGRSCDELAKAIDDLRPKARECCIECRTLQCTKVVEDLCCPLSVTEVDPQFVALVAEHKQRCPGVPCPTIPCAASPSSKCAPTQDTPIKGSCE